MTRGSEMLTPEERKGLEELLAECGPAGPAVAWLKRQLAHDDYDKQLERMGGGRKGRNGYMKPVFDERCSVTAFDMHAQLMKDQRGLWLWLNDESRARAETYKRWEDAALEEFCKIAGLEQHGIERFRVAMAMDKFKDLSNSKTDDSALLEWPAVKKLYAVIGKAIKEQEAREAKEEPIKARTPRKPDRRNDKRRRDDKRKARLAKV